MLKRNHLERWITFPFVVALSACVGDEPITVEQSDDPIDQLFAALGPLPADAPRRIEGTPSQPVTDGDYQCVTTPVDEVRAIDQLLGQLSVGDVP